MLWRKAVFVLLMVFCLSPLGSPAAALILGLGVAFTIGDPFPQLDGRLTHLIFSLSVLLLGLDTNLPILYQTAKDGALVVVVFTVIVIVLGLLALRLVAKNDLFLASFASAAAFDRDEEEQGDQPASYLLILCAVFLAVSPFIGQWFRLTPRQFGLWSTVAAPFGEASIGAPLAVNADAVNAATALTLIKVLLLSMVGWTLNRFSKKHPVNMFPWLVPAFVLVVLLRTYAPTGIFPSVFDGFVNLGGAGVLLTLFLLGAGLSPAALTKTQVKPIALISLVWIALSALGLWAVLRLV
jgi:uncharacterized membrane protein YadS